jgi:AraC-like DNA-binding protein
MDVLTDVLNSLRLRSGLYCRSTMTAPWGLGFRPTTVATFHVIDRGDCFLRIDGDPTPLALAGGDLIVFPHGAGHQLADDPGTPARWQIPLDEVMPDECMLIALGGGGATTSLLCGTFCLERADAHPLLALLPPLIHIRGHDDGAATWLETTLQFLTSEAGAQRPGAETIVRRLTEVLFVQVVRAWIEGHPTETRGWLSALGDPRIGAAIGLLHRRPAQAWQVAELAAEVGLSRSAFAARFSALVGQPPLNYLAGWRMQLAAELLRTGDLALSEVAERVGYGSEPAFSKAFKRRVGLGPGAYRRARRVGGPGDE